MVKASTTEVSSTQVGSISEELIHAGSAQVDCTQLPSANVDIIQVSSTKIPFPIDVASEQFFSSHNISPASIYDIHNTALTLWNTYLQFSSPLNLDLVIKDLPTGQLAEANITGFDPSCRPNAGTLTLDIDANGLGWYIDPTPAD